MAADGGLGLCRALGVLGAAIEGVNSPICFIQNNWYPWFSSSCSRWSGLRHSRCKPRTFSSTQYALSLSRKKSPGIMAPRVKASTMVAAKDLKHLSRK